MNNKHKNTLTAWIMATLSVALMLAVSFVPVLDADDEPAIYGAEGPYDIYLRAGESYSYAPTVKTMTYPDGLTMTASIPNAISNTMNFGGSYDDGWLLSGKINTPNESGYNITLTANWTYTREGVTNPDIHQEDIQRLVFHVYDNVKIDGSATDSTKEVYLFTSAKAGDSVYTPNVTGPTGTTITVTGADAPFTWDSTAKKLKLTRDLTSADVGVHEITIKAKHDVQGTALGEQVVELKVKVTVSNELEITSEKSQTEYTDTTLAIYQVTTNYDSVEGVSNLTRTIEDLPQGLPAGFVKSNANGILQFDPSKIQMDDDEAVRNIMFTAKATGTYANGSPVSVSETITLKIVKKLAFITSIEDAIITAGEDLTAFATATVNNATKVSIDWGDNRTTTADVVDNRIEERHTYSAPGMYNVVMTAVDGATPAVQRLSVTVYEEEETHVTTLNPNGAQGNAIQRNNITIAPSCPDTFVKEGFHFVKWNTKADGTGTSYIAGQSMDPANVPILYAIWAANPVYETVLHANNGTQQTVVKENLTVAPENPFIYTGHTFVKWNTKADGTGVDYFRITSPITASQVPDLYAQWSATSEPIFHITLFPNGGTGEEYLEPNPREIPPNYWFTKTGWHFTEWNTKADGSGTSYVPGTQIELEEDLALYAQWVQNEPVGPSEDENNDYTWAKVLSAIILVVTAVGFILTRMPLFAGISGAALIALIITVVLL